MQTHVRQTLRPPKGISPAFALPLESFWASPFSMPVSKSCGIRTFSPLARRDRSANNLAGMCVWVRRCRRSSLISRCRTHRRSACWSRCGDLDRAFDACRSPVENRRGGRRVVEGHVLSHRVLDGASVFSGPDLPYFAAWVTLFLIGPGPFSADAYLFSVARKPPLGRTRRERRIQQRVSANAAGPRPGTITRLVFLRGWEHPSRWRQARPRSRRSRTGGRIPGRLKRRVRRQASEDSHGNSSGYEAPRRRR